MNEQVYKIKKEKNTVYEKFLKKIEKPLVRAQ